MRLAKQVLVLPFRIIDDNIQYCIFKRKDRKIWQFVAGGAEDFDIDILDSAKRELFEETGILNNYLFYELEEYIKIPVVNISKDFIFGEDVYFVEEFAFAVNVLNNDISLSLEHDEYFWVSYDEAYDILRYDSNKSALWELNEKIKRGIIK